MRMRFSTSVQQPLEAFHVQLLETVAHRLAHQRVIGHDDVAR